jgi:type I restriction enzyme S subunit
MNIKQGYKQTEIGIIPEDWEAKKFGDVTISCSSGATPYRGRPEYYKGKVKWITSGELNYNLITDTIEHISEEAVRNTNLKTHPVGTFLIAITGLEAAGTRGSCGIVGNPATTNQSCMAIYPTSELLTSYLYHYYVYRGNELAFRYCQGTKQQSYTAKLVKLLPIHLPPLKEQTAIATALSDIDALIGELDKLIAKKQGIKQATMQQLLTGKKRLAGFGSTSKYKQTEIGIIPEDWNMKALKNLNLDISDGNYSSKYPKSSDFVQIGVPFIRANNIHNMKVLDDDMRFISHKQHSELFKGHIKRNDILITTRGDIGQIAIVPECHIDSNINAQLVRINTENREVDYCFLAYSMLAKKSQQQFDILETGSALKQLPVGRLVQLLVPIPPLPEQTAIAHILSDMDAEISQLEGRRAKMGELKQGMMQELLTGRIRLTGGRYL